MDNQFKKGERFYNWDIVRQTPDYLHQLKKLLQFTIRLRIKQARHELSEDQIPDGLQEVSTLEQAENFCKNFVPPLNSNFSKVIQSLESSYTPSQGGENVILEKFTAELVGDESIEPKIITQPKEPIN